MTDVSREAALETALRKTQMIVGSQDGLLIMEIVAALAMPKNAQSAKTVDKTLVSEADLNEALAAIIGPWWSEASANMIRGGKLSVADIKAKYVLRDLFAKHIAAALAARPEQPAADTRVVPTALLHRTAGTLEATEACLKTWNGSGSFMDVDGVMSEIRAIIGGEQGK